MYTYIRYVKLLLLVYNLLLKELQTDPNIQQIVREEQKISTSVKKKKLHEKQGQTFLVIDLQGTKRLQNGVNEECYYYYHNSILLLLQLFCRSENIENE